MTVGAAAVEVEVRQGSIPLTVAAVVTFVAKSRLPHLEEPVIHRAVRIMTVGAVLKHRWMLPEKGAAPFAMAAVTVLVDAGLYEL